jgi:hypothetical protein
MGNPPPLRNGDPLAEISRKLEGLLASLNNLEATIKAQGEKIESRLQGLEKSGASSQPTEPLVDVNRLVHISHTEGTLQTSVANLDHRISAHGERIEQLLQWASIVPYLEKELDKNTNDLNKLGQKRVAKLENLAHTVKTIAWAIATLGSGLLVWFLSGLPHPHR